ncbi:MAG: BTAD domain-containing putative transcriptional regulator [Saprospiraceae bacterium]
MRMPTPYIVLFGGNEKAISGLKSLFDRKAVLKPYRIEDASVFSLAETAASYFVVFAEKNGSKSIAALRTLQSQFPAIPRIVLAAPALLEQVDDYVSAGCSRFLFYPQQADRLLDLIATESTTLPGSAPSRDRNNFTGAILNMINQALSIGIVPKSVARIISLSTLPDLPPTGIQAQFLGNFEVCIEGNLLPELKGKKLKLLLAYLLYQAPRQIHKNTLADLFWGDIDTAANSLQVAVCQLRKHIRETTGYSDLISHENERYFINPAYALSSDAASFRTFWQDGQLQELRSGLEEALPAYHEAIGQYNGEFMEDLGRHCEPWIEQERNALSEKYLHVLERMGVYFFREGNPTVAINLCQRILEKEPYFETAYRLLMICYDQLGQRGHAIATYQKCTAALWEQYKIKPSAETEAAYRKMVSGVGVDGRLSSCA